MRKRPVNCPQIMQMEALECGAACLAMVLAYYGKWVPLEQLRSDCGVSRNGSNAKDMAVAARSHGLTTQGYRVEPEGLKNLPWPCIIFWNFNHFVVFRGFTKKGALLNDPARGRVISPAAEFNKSFTGIALSLEPGAGFTKGGRPRSALAFIRPRMKGMAAPFFFVFLTGLISTLIAVVNPVFGRIFLDRILPEANASWLSALALIMLGLAVVQLMTGIFQSVYLLKIGGKFAAGSGAQFLWRVLRLPMEFFSQRIAADIMLRQRANQRVAITLLETLAPQFLNGIMLVFYLLVMLSYSAPLSLAGLGALITNIVLTRTTAKQRIAIAQVYSRDVAKAEGSVLTGINMIETLKATGAEDAYFERCAGYQAAMNTSFQRNALIKGPLKELPGLLQGISGAMILGLGAYFIMEGKFTIGMLMAFQSFLSACMAPVISLAGADQQIQEMRVDMERIEDVFRYPVEARPPALQTGQDWKKLSGSLVMKDVSFGYSRLAPPQIEHFDLELKPGKSVAFVGSSGCGKSTLAKLISGLYRPWSGEIFFDGMAAETIPREIITGSVAVVDQDITIFADTISNNIKVWDKSIEDFEVIMAARDAQIHQDVLLRENGYNYQMREGGTNFSGGQRQRLEIARVLAQDPTIIIMDEATSALDAQTEGAVVRAIKDRGITCIFIAHRLSTIRDCDEIIVLDKGRVAERGSHETLLAAGAYYARLVRDE